jgi:superfamily II DNA/RNA helicase
LLSITNVLKNQHHGVATQLAGGLATVFRIEGGKTAPDLLTAQHAVLVATPAAVLALAAKPEFGAWLKRRVGVVVIDEIDGLMQDPSKKGEVTRVAELCGAAHVQAFTATHSTESLDWMTRVSGAGGREVVHIDASDRDATNHTHAQWTVAPRDVMPALHAILTAVPREGEVVVRKLQRMHSKMGNNKRLLANAQKEFAECERCTVLCSDVASRGMDFPGVTLVIQVGYAPADLYKQRIGRSGRGTQGGRGVLLLAAPEAGRCLAGIAKLEPPVELTSYTAATLQENAVTGRISSTRQAFKSLFGAYATALKWRPDQTDAVARPMFEGAGQDMSGISAPEPKGGRKQKRGRTQKRRGGAPGVRARDGRTRAAAQVATGAAAR